ncbi:MAG: DUF5615 family PIN-like protein [Spirochaetaceae bacterium]|nr:DUF5615 family PIN-like protein [Spirochaetaceae bacterium]
MRFLADESCDYAVIRALRSAGHDVVAIADAYAQAPDIEVAALAVSDGRVLLTEDKDFGQLVFAYGEASLGVVLLRYPAQVRGAMGDDVVDLAAKHGDRLAGSFVVVAPAQIRFRPMPG